MKKIIVVADWARDSLYRQEFDSAVSGNMRSQEDPKISFVGSQSQSLNVAFLLEQVARIERRMGRPQHTVLVQATERVSDPSVERDVFLVVKMHSGLTVCGYNVGYAFSLLLSGINELFRYDVEQTPSAFKSRDVYSRVIAHFAEEMEHELQLEEEHMSVIPKVTSTHVLHTDSFGNIITNLTGETLKGMCEYEEYIHIRIGHKAQRLRYVDSPFRGDKNELVIAPGSEGDKSQPYLEVYALGARLADAAWARYGKPLAGEKIEVF